MRRLEFPSYKDLFVGEIARNGRWVVANVESNVGWPLKVTKAVFRDRAIFLLPPTHNENTANTYPAIAIRLDAGEAFEDGQVLLSHFLSSLSWVHGQRISIEHWSGGNLPRPMGGDTGKTVVSEIFYEPYLPDPKDQKTRWCMAFYREGLTLNHPAYQFLSFFKILNSFLPRGADQKRWINVNLGNVSEHQARKRLQDLKHNQTDIGAYLYESGRCAIAHAGLQPTVDPENPHDLRRLREDLPLMRALAELAIEQEFGIKSSSTMYREHLYELEGFHQLLQPKQATELVTSGTLPSDAWPIMPDLSIRLAMHDQYAPLETMSGRVINAIDGALFVQCINDAHKSQVLLKLNFKDERLQLDPLNGIALADDGSEQAARSAIDMVQFQVDYLMNGILEVWSMPADKMLSRCDAYLPLNIDLGRTHENYQKILAELRAEADRRSIS